MKVEYRIHRDICIAAIENAIKRMCSRYLQIRSVDDFHIDSLTFIAIRFYVCQIINVDYYNPRELIHLNTSKKLMIYKKKEIYKKRRKKLFDAMYYPDTHDEGKRIYNFLQPI